MKLIWTKRAVREYSAQLDYIALDKSSAADRMQQIVDKTCRMLPEWPNMGKTTRIPGILELVVPQTPFVVRYRSSKTAVTILRFYHAAQNR